MLKKIRSWLNDDQGDRLAGVLLDGLPPRKMVSYSGDRIP